MAREIIQAHQEAELEQRFEAGGIAAALIRALIYIQLPRGSVDERGFAMLRAIREAQPEQTRISMAQAKELIKNQYLLLRRDAERAIRAIPSLLPSNTEERRTALNSLHRVVQARGVLPEEGKRRLARIESLFEPSGEEPAKAEVVHA